MKTIGQILKSARARKKYSLKKLEDLTKIKRGFLSAVEKEAWGDLPPFPTVLGFVKSISTTLDIDEKGAVAVLKRDYPPKMEAVNPKPDVSSRFIWSPKLTFVVGIGIVMAGILGYLIFQYGRFISPPSLKIDSPKEGQILTDQTVTVSGSTDSDALVSANNQPVLVDQDGKFTGILEITPETKEIAVKSVSRSGKETVIYRKITVQ